MAERRVLALLGPCRVDGVGGGVGFEDLRGFDGVDLDALHDDFTSVALVAALGRLRDAVVAASHAAADAAWSPLGLSAPSARFACCSWWPDLPLPPVAVPAPASTAKAKRRSGGVPSPVDRASPDQRWLDPARAEDALALLSAAAERVAVDGPDVDAETTTPAGAAARAVALLDAAPETARANANTDVAWIVAGVDGGGGGDGEWPPEAVAAHGVLLAARRAGARAVVVVLTPPDTSRRGEGDDDEGPSARDEGEIDRADDDVHHHHHEGGLDAPRLILDVAARAGAEVIVLPAGAAPRPSSSASTRPSSASPLSIFFDPGERWRGALTIPSRDGGVRATLPGFRITSGDARRARDASEPAAASEPPAASFGPRASGDATLVEVVRLEVIPRECLCDRAAPLRVVADADADATTTATLDALTAATRASSPGGAPAFVVRVPHLATEDGHKTARRSALAPPSRSARSFAATTNVPPPPHDRGALLLVRADGEGGFEARAFASVPTLLRRASAIARAAASAAVVDAVEEEVTADGGGAATPASVASTGRKRKRARRGGGEPQTSGEADAGRRGRPGLDSEDDATESAETTELALKSVAVMDVNPSLADALGAARGDEDGDEGGDGDEEKDATVRLPGDADDAMGATTATATANGAPGTPSSAKNAAAIWIPTTRVEPARCSSARGRHPPFTRVLDALVRRREAEEARVAACPFGPPSSQPGSDDPPDGPFLTAALLRAARDVAAGREAVRAAVRDAREEETSAERDAANAERAAGMDEIVDAGAGAGALAALRETSRSRSKSGASPSREIPAVGPPMDWAAAERELQERVQRERRERRERQRMTMAPRHVPARRRTGNTILAAATGRGGGGGAGGGGGGVGVGVGSRAGRANVGSARAGGQAKSGVGSPPGGSRVEPSESAVGAGAAGGGADARRARVCTNCHIELAPIPGVNMNLMKHCYACGGAL